VYLFMGVGLTVMGVFGYFQQKRRGPAGDVRGLLLWYALAWPFLACCLTAEFYPRWRWLYIVAGVMSVGNAAVQISGRYRAWRRRDPVSGRRLRR
jgi:hypothetical protein